MSLQNDHVQVQNDHLQLQNNFQQVQSDNINLTSMLKNLNAENKMLRQKAKEVEGKYLKIPKPSTGKKYHSTQPGMRPSMKMMMMMFKSLMFTDKVSLTY